MDSVTQIGFQIDDQSLAALDRVAVQDSTSRAEVLRRAVRHFLARRRREEIDARIAAGYGARPPGPEEDGLADRSVEGLRAGRLDW